MSAIIPLTAGAIRPAYLQRKDIAAAINNDVGTSASFPVLSIKGKVFALVKDGERKVLTRADDPDEVVQFVSMTVVRANTKSRVFYAKNYVEGDDGDTKRPDCQSSDGVAPSADARDPQSKKCDICPHAVWGSKVSTDGNTSKGTACSVNTRLAVVDPEQLMGDQIEPYLLRVPAGSRSNFADAVKTAKARGIPYNALVLKVGFDKEAPAPKLTFKLTGLVSDPAYDKIGKLYEGDTIKAILGMDAPAATADHDETPAAPAPKPAPKPAAVDADELAAVLAAAAPAPKPAPKPKPKPAPAPVEPDPEPEVVAAPAPAPKAASKTIDADDLLEGLDALLGNADD